MQKTNLRRTHVLIDAHDFAKKQYTEDYKNHRMYVHALVPNKKSGAASENNGRSLELAQARARAVLALGLNGLGSRSDNYVTYLRYKSDKTYHHVRYNKLTDGVCASHIGHRFDHKKCEYELEVLKAGVNGGYAVILEDETDYKPSTPHTEGTWNGKKFEIAARETATANNIKRGLKHCAQKKETQIAVLSFPLGGFEMNNLKKGICLTLRKVDSPTTTKCTNFTQRSSFSISTK